jgi:hypothetical protein
VGRAIACHNLSAGVRMDITTLVPGLVGACVGSIGWLFVGLYINKRTGLHLARNAGRAVFFELELNRVSVLLARDYGELMQLSRSTYEQLLPQLANLLKPGDLSTIAAAYMSHIGYEQLRQSRDQPADVRQAALSGIFGAQEAAIARLRTIVFTPAEQAQLPAGGVNVAESATMAGSEGGNG